jgi:hypothetical protein
LHTHGSCPQTGHGSSGHPQGLLPNTGLGCGGSTSVSGFGCIVLRQKHQPKSGMMLTNLLTRPTLCWAVFVCVLCIRRNTT